VNNSKSINSNNWRKHPNNEWSFQNIEKLFSTQRIKKGDQKPSKFIVKNAPIDKIEFSNLEGKKQTIRKMLANGYADSFLVLKEGKIIYEEYFNGMSQSSLHLINSISKNFLGMLTGILKENKLIDPNKKISEYVSEFRQSAFSETTLRHALDMTAAVKYDETYDNPNADFWHETSTVGWNPCLEKENPSNLLDYALSIEEKEQLDGSSYHYRTILTNIIAITIEAATEEKMSHLLETLIWQKLLPEQDLLMVVDNKDYPYMGAGLNACTRDLARFGQMLLQQGTFNGNSVIPASWIQETVTAGQAYKENFSKDPFGEVFPNGHYKNQTIVDKNGCFYCLGIYGQCVYINPKYETVIVKLSSQPGPAIPELLIDSVIAMNKIASAA
tara:strand:+ start:80 stop:1237 length:1158 start_codon:yes stop_codon:yes gene_type:complete